MNQLLFLIVLFLPFSRGFQICGDSTRISPFKTSSFLHVLNLPRRHQVSLLASNDADNGDDQQSNRTCLRYFLTQRAVQSFMFLLGECRDPHSADWIERFCDSHNLLEYHGTGAFFNMTKFPQWDSILAKMIENPMEKIIIQARRRGGGRGGWSKNNPYLQDRFVEYEIAIDPQNLATRILSVREQITRELRDDLTLILKSNEKILMSYSEKMREARNLEKGQETSDKKLLDHEQLQESPDSAFDQDAAQLFRDNISLEPLASSPLRRGTFDLAQLLSMQESIHVVLKNYQSMGESKEVSFQFLRDFYINKLNTHFDGNLAYGRADDFISQLLMTPPSLKQCPDGRVGFIDPFSVAEDIIKTRSEVVRDWMQITENIPKEHISIRRALYSNQIGKVDSSMGTVAHETDSFE